MRFTSKSEAPPLRSDLASSIPDGQTYVLVLFDGLGVAQLEHPRAGSLRESNQGTLHAGFPATTSTSLATVATGLPPGQHGIIAHLTWMPEHQRVVNTLKWVDPAGAPVEHDYAGVLPRRNLWERLRESGIEPISVQPGDFRGTPLTRVLYRGARFEGIWDIDDLVSATVQLAETPGRLIFAYVPHVDFAGHVHGQDSTEFAEAMKLANRVWDELRRRLPPGASLIGTADHGLIDYDEEDKHLIREPSFDTMRFAGDPRGLHLWGNRATVEELAQVTGGELVEPASLLGPEPTDEFTRRTGDHLLLAPPGKLLLPRGFDKRLRAYHGGLAAAELEIPLLIG